MLVPGHPQFEKVMKDLSTQKSSLDDINHSAKLPALKYDIQRLEYLD